MQDNEETEMHVNAETDRLVQEVVRRLRELDLPAPPGSRPESPAERAVRELRRGSRPTWEELHRPACPW